MTFTKGDRVRSNSSAYADAPLDEVEGMRGLEGVVVAHSESTNFVEVEFPHEVSYGSGGEIYRFKRALFYPEELELMSPAKIAIPQAIRNAMYRLAWYAGDSYNDSLISDGTLIEDWLDTETEGAE